MLDSGTVEDLSLDSEREKNRTRDPSITMEARHRQVRVQDDMTQDQVLTSTESLRRFTCY